MLIDEKLKDGFNSKVSIFSKANVILGAFFKVSKKIAALSDILLIHNL